MLISAEYWDLLTDMLTQFTIFLAGVDRGKDVCMRLVLWRHGLAQGYFKGTTWRCCQPDRPKQRFPPLLTDQSMPRLSLCTPKPGESEIADQIRQRRYPRDLIALDCQSAIVSVSWPYGIFNWLSYFLGHPAILLHNPLIAVSSIRIAKCLVPKCVSCQFPSWAALFFFRGLEQNLTVKSGWNSLLGAIRSDSSLPGDFRELLVIPIIILWWFDDNMNSYSCRRFLGLPHSIRPLMNGSSTKKWDELPVWRPHNWCVFVIRSNRSPIRLIILTPNYQICT